MTRTEPGPARQAAGQAAQPGRDTARSRRYAAIVTTGDRHA